MLMPFTSVPLRPRGSGCIVGWPEESLFHQASGSGEAGWPHGVGLLAEPAGYLGEHGGQGVLALAERQQVENERVHLAGELQCPQLAVRIFDPPAGLSRLEELHEPKLRPAAEPQTEQCLMVTVPFEQVTGGEPHQDGLAVGVVHGSVGVDPDPVAPPRSAAG